MTQKDKDLAFVQMEQRMKFWDEYQYPQTKEISDDRNNSDSKNKFRLFNWLWRKNTI